MSDVSRVRPVAVASRVYPTPELSRLRSVNVAVPATAFTEVVPDRVDVPGLLFIEKVMLSVSAVRLSKASLISTVTAGVIFALYSAVDGWVIIANLDFAAGVILKLVEVSVVRTAELATRSYPVKALSRLTAVSYTHLTLPTTPYV